MTLLGLSIDLHLWLEYLLRFSHLVAGIAWIGSSFYFIWLDSSFEAPETPRKNVEGETFMVHGGFYYRVEKRKIHPGELPKTLHWFKWEATLTWVTGGALFIVLYYLRGASLLVDREIWAFSQAEAIGVSLGVVVGSWVVYDFLWHDRLKGIRAFTGTLSVLIFLFTPYFLSGLFSGRGTFILMGVILGTSMILNVWIRILPNQAKMLADAERGDVPDAAIGLKSKTRSVHNTYFIFPVLFIMLSNHYPSLYNHPHRAWVLVLLALAGGLTRHAMVTKSVRGRWMLAPAALSLAVVIGLTATRQSRGGLSVDSMPSLIQPSAAPVAFSDLHAVLEKRCYACHSSHPTDDVYRTPPSGIVFEKESEVRAKADRIFLHVITARSMPLGNKTGMLDSERSLVGHWLIQQGLVNKPGSD